MSKLERYGHDHGIYDFTLKLEIIIIVIIMLIIVALIH